MENYLEEARPQFRKLLPMMDRIASGFTFTEGPVWNGSELLFSDIPNSRTVRYRPLPEGPEVTTFRTPTNGTNGMTLDHAGNLICCEHLSRSVTSVAADGTVTTLADRFEGKRLNSPNDVVVRSDGTIFFTDPPYGLKNKTEGKELPFSAVFKLTSDGTLSVVADDFVLPNGLAFSPDEQTLYVADSEFFHIRALTLDASDKMATSTVWAELKPGPGEKGVVDGMKIDVEGNVYCTGPGGVWIFNGANGLFLGRIAMPEVTANLAWGDEDLKTLYMTGSTSLYRIRIAVAGLPVGPSAKH